MKKQTGCNQGCSYSGWLPCCRSSWLVSAALHLVVPFLFGAFIVEGPKYAIASSSRGHQSSAVTVELVAPAPAAAVVEQTQSIVPDEVQHGLEKPLVKVEPEKKKLEQPITSKKKMAQPEQLQPRPVRAIESVPAAPVPVEQVAATSSASGIGEATTTATASPDYLRNPAPHYPRESRYAKEEGTVVVAVDLDSEGDVQGVSLRESSHFERLDQAAVKAVKSWKFKPAKIAGVGVEAAILVPVKFVLQKED